MTLLDNHLEQISLSSAAIAELPFLPPKAFTNALLHSHDITTLIRDTELHERALFTLAPVDQTSASPRSTFHGLKSNGELNANGSGLVHVPRHESAVAMLLDDELGDQFRKGEIGEVKERGEVDVDVLLRGAERLCGVYPIPGAAERIASLRSRYDQLTSSIARYETRVSKQTVQLAKMNRQKDYDEDLEDGEQEDLSDEDESSALAPAAPTELHITAEDLRREEDEIRELEKRKRGLEDRVSGMERDLGGLLR